MRRMPFESAAAVMPYIAADPGELKVVCRT